MIMLSEHFSLEELTFSQMALRTGLDNTPDPLDVQNLKRLCLELLEPARIILGVPLHVDSGYRSPQLNSLVGGALDSAHMSGQAADVIPIGMPILDAFHDLRVHADLPYDQLITEANAWIHIAIAPDGEEPRREALTATGGPGNWHYALVA